MESAYKFKAPKVKELKVLDAKSAQNICKCIDYYFNPSASITALINPFVSATV